jgi:hypothetical protein
MTKFEAVGTLIGTARLDQLDMDLGADAEPIHRVVIASVLLNITSQRVKEYLHVSLVLEYETEHCASKASEDIDCRGSWRKRTHSATVRSTRLRVENHLDRCAHRRGFHIWVIDNLKATASAVDLAEISTMAGPMPLLVVWSVIHC